MTVFFVSPCTRRFVHGHWTTHRSTSQDL